MSTAILGCAEITGVPAGKRAFRMKSNKGSLARFVRRIMKQKRLTLRDVEARSGGGITDGYVADFVRGASENPSALKIKGLARGLGVDAHALFDVICGPFEKATSEQAGEDTSDVLSFLEMMHEVAESPQLMKLLEEAIQLSSEERAVVLQSAESFNERRLKTKRGKKSLRVRR